MVVRAVLRRRLADDLGEARAERAERRAAYGDAGVGDRGSLTQKSFSAFDASRHEIGVRGLAIRGTELAREVRRRHERGTRYRRDIEGLRVVAVHEVARPAQMHKVGDLLRRHTDDVTRRAPGDHPDSPVLGTRGTALSTAWVTSLWFRFLSPSVWSVDGLRHPQ
jgi:hypothetical protein